MESISARQVIDRLSDGCEITTEDEAKYQAELMSSAGAHLISGDLVHGPAPVDELAGRLLDISSICNEFLKSTEYDPEEVKRIDKLWEIIDNSLLEYDIEKIESVADDVGRVIRSRRQKYFEMEEEKRRKEFKENENG